jgi:hypothetical protein
LLKADLWIHPNLPGQIHSSDREPVRLLLKEGIALYPDDGSNHPRLPLLGLRALLDNHLRLTVNGWQRSVTLATQRRWWPFD